MYSQNDEFKNRLSRAKYSVTPARQLVFEVLRLHGPQTMNELVKLTFHDIDRATVYRVIKLFESLDIISRIQIGWKYKLELSEAFNAHHHHLTCMRCGKLIDVEPGPDLEVAISKLAATKQFSLRSHQLEISGLCNDCQKKDPGYSPGSVGSLTLPN